MRIKTKTFLLFGIILLIQGTVSGVIVKNVLFVGNRQKYIRVLDNNLVVIGKIRNQVGRQLMLSLLYVITGEKNYRLRFERSDQAVKRFIAKWNSSYGENRRISDISSKYALFQEKNRRLFHFIAARNRVQGYKVFNQEILSEFADTEGQALNYFLNEKISAIDRSYDELLMSSGFFPLGKGNLMEEMQIVKKVYLYFTNLSKTFSYINRYLTNSALIFLSGPEPEKFKESVLGIQFDFILHEWEGALRAFPEHDTFLRIEGRSFFEDVEGALLYIQQKMVTVKSKMRDGKTEEATHIFIRSIESVLDFILYPTINSALDESNLLIFKMNTRIERTISFSRNVTIFLLILFNLVILLTSIRFLRELTHSFRMILEKLHGFSFKKDNITLNEHEISEIELLFDAREEEFAALVRKNSLFEKIVDSIKTPFFVVSGNVRIERANRAFCALLGYTRKELEGLHPGKVFPHVSAFEKEDLEDFFIRSKSPEERHTLLNSKRKKVPVILSSSLIHNTAQQSSYAVFVVLTLEDTGKTLSSPASVFLSQPKEESAGLIVEGIVNEYNRSVRNTLGYLKFIIENHKEELSVSVVENLENISREAWSGAGLSENLSALFIADKVEKKQFNLNAAVGNTLKRLGAKKNGIVVRTDYDNLDPEIFFSRDQLDFILLSVIELLDHSVQSKERERLLFMKTFVDGNVVKIILREPADGYTDECASVSDILAVLKGYPSKVLLSVLMISSILKRYGGKIVAWRNTCDNLQEEEKICDLKFVLEIPGLTREIVSVPASPVGSTEPLKFSFRNRNILIVDDEKTIREWLQALVTGHDGTPYICENGAEAIEQLKKNTFDLVISDLKMPEVSGYELGEWIEKENAPMLERFILVTGLRDRELEDYCLKKGCHFLTKPVRSEALLELAVEIMR